MAIETPTAPKENIPGLQGFMSSLNSEPVDLSSTGQPPQPTPNPPPAPEPPKPPEPIAPVEKPEVLDADDPRARPRNAQEWDNYKLSDKQKRDAITKERDDIRKERDAVRQEIDALRKQGPSPELEALKKERDELSERLRVSDVENHPKFKQYFEQKTGAQVDLAKRLVGTERAERMEELLKMPDGAFKDQEIEEFVLDLSPVKQGQIAGVLNALESIKQEREREVSHARENHDRISAEQKLAADNAVKERVTGLQKAFDDGVARVTDKKDGLFMFQKREGDDETVKAWNAGVDERLAKAKAVMFGQNKPDFVVNTILSSVATPALLEAHTTALKTIETLEAQVKSLSAAAPKSAGGGGEAPKNGEQPRNVPKPGSAPGEAMQTWVKGMVQARNEG